MADSRKSVNVGNLPKDGRSYHWTIVFYPDSAPDDFREVIRSWHVPVWMSPLHCDDVTATGEKKKPHYHLILKFSSKKSCKQIQDLSNELSGVNVLIEECMVRDFRGAIRYLVHYDDPNKAQYPVSSIEVFCGADYMDYFTGASDVDLCVGEMMDWLDNDDMSSFSKLARYAKNNNPAWFRVLSSKRTVFLAQYAKAVGWEKAQEKKIKAIEYAKGGKPVHFCEMCGEPATEIVNDHRGGQVKCCESCAPLMRKICDENLEFEYKKKIEDLEKKIDSAT